MAIQQAEETEGEKQHLIAETNSRINTLCSLFIGESETITMVFLAVEKFYRFGCSVHSIQYITGELLMKRESLSTSIKQFNFSLAFIRLQS